MIESKETTLQKDSLSMLCLKLLFDKSLWNGHLSGIIPERVMLYIPQVACFSPRNCRASGLHSVSSIVGQQYVDRQTNTLSMVDSVASSQ